MPTAYRFQYNLVKTMQFTEDTYFELAESSEQNCLVICDRGTMDAVSCKWTPFFLLLNIMYITINICLMT